MKSIPDILKPFFNMKPGSVMVDGIEVTVEEQIKNIEACIKIYCKRFARARKTAATLIESANKYEAMIDKKTTMKKDIPAFACVTGTDRENGYLQEGMTLRDYFAATILNAQLIVFDSDWDFDVNAVTKRAYVIADAMLAAREKC